MEDDAIAARAGDRVAAARIVADLRPYAVGLATRLGVIDVDDAVSEAMVALLTAVQRYDVARNCPFEAYAKQQMRFAIVEWIRGDVCSGRSITDSLDAPMPSSEGRVNLHDRLADPLATDPEIGAGHAETWRSIGRLPAAAREVLIDRLLGLSEQTIASRRGLSQQRVSQIAHEAAAALSS